MLGRDLVVSCEERGHEVVGLSHAQLDITDSSSVARAVSEHRPDVVANCAAYTDVDGAEEHEADAMRVNDEGAGVLAAAAANAGASVLYPSSDYVFDGRRRR